MSALILYAVFPIVCIVCLQSIPQKQLHYLHLFEHLVLFVFVIYWALDWSRKYIYSTRIDPSTKVVLIIGCGSGFGHAFAKKLDAEGYTVFAGVRNINCDGAFELQKTCSKRIHVIALDVTKDESVQEALEYVKRNMEGKELWAVVNNAGVLYGVSIEFTSMDIYKKVTETNTFGLMRMTKEFLPLLRQSKGRMIAINSPCGRVSAPCFSAYSQSKAACISFCDTLRQEVHKWGIKVISMEPEIYKTNMLEVKKQFTGFDDLWNERADLRQVYGEDYDERLRSFVESVFSWGSTNVCQVTDDLYDAVSLVYPHHIYKTRRNILATCTFYFVEHLPNSITDFMFRIPFSYIVGCPIN